jgi:hypothetical protein
MRVKVTILLSSYPIALRALPEYPGRKLGIHFESGDSVTVFSQYRKCYYLHGDGNRYEIRFYELVDGIGWIHDFDVKSPKQRTILIKDSSEIEAAEPDSVLMSNISSHPIFISSFPEYPGDQTMLSFEPGECAYVNSEFRKVYFVHSDGQRYCIRFYRLFDHSGWIHDFNPTFPLRRNLSQEILELPICQLRSLAQLSELREISHSQVDHLISFKSNQLRHNVYYKTGTVATISMHPRLGKTYHFRHKQSLEEIRQIFAGTDYSELNSSLLDYTDDDGEEFATRNQIARLTEEANRIEREKATLLTNLELFDQIRDGELKRSRWRETNDPKPSERNERSKHSDSETEDRGRSLFGGPPVIARSLTSSPIRSGKSLPNQVPAPRQDQTLDQSFTRLRQPHRSLKGGNIRCNFPEPQSDFITQNWCANVSSLAIGGQSIVFIYDDYSWSSTNGLPPLLLKRLQTRPTHLSPPAYVAAGSMNRCFLSFSDGSSEWNASEGFHRCIQEQNGSVTRVAFGRHWNSFVILFDNGTFRSNNIPTELEVQLSKREESHATEVYLGPNGEWFLAREDGKVSWMAKSCESVAKELGSSITDMIFGSSGTFIIRYR